MQDIIVQLAPITFVSAVYAVIVYKIAVKRRINPWPWVVGTMIPGLGFIISTVFFLASLMSVFDRLNALEGKD